MPPHSEFTPEHYASTSNVCRIRSMVQTDIPSVYAIDQDTWKDQSWPLEYFFSYLNDPETKCWILDDNNKTNNCKILGYGFQSLSNGISHIANLCIHPDERGRGFGGILLRYMIDFSQQFDVSIIELQVHTSNTNAYTLYYKHGFRIIQYLERYYSDTEDAYLMRLRINRFASL